MSAEINGCYRNPVTGRYYRYYNGANYTRISQSMLSQAKDVDPLIYATPKLTNFPDLLQCREYGLRKSNVIDLPVLKLKLKSLKISEPEHAINVYNWVQEIMYLKGGKDSIFALWESFGTLLYSNWLVIGEVVHYLTNDQPFDLGVIRSLSGVTDFCEGFNNSKCFMSVSNDFANGRGKLQVLWRKPESDNVEEWVRSHSKKTTVWCCCCNSFIERFAIGSEGAIDIDTATKNLYNRQVNGNVHAVQFNDSGSIVFCGVHTGKLCTVDLRDNTTMETKIYNVGIDETVLLSDQCTILCGTFNGKICKFDLRMMDIVTEYYGHIHTPKKVPFSVSESANLLCATGSDNVTRLWSLDGGHPIKVIHPPKVNFMHRSWLVSDAWTARMYIIQRDKKYHYKINV